MEAQIEALRAAFRAESEDIERIIGQEERREAQLDDDRSAMARSRKTGASREGQLVPIRSKSR